MSAEHFILATIFLVLFIVPLAWLFLIDRPRGSGMFDPADATIEDIPVPVSRAAAD